MNSSSRFFGAIFLCAALIFGLSLVPFHSALAEDTEGIMIQRDVYLNSPILTAQDLPDELSVSLYDSQTGLTPLATQTFPRGAYTLDFELSKTNGVELGPIARLKVYFTNKLNLGDDPNNPTLVREIWSEVSVNGQPIVGRLKVSDETMVRLLLASDASIATYVTFAYQGDSNPITTIYRALPLASASGLSATQYVNSLFSAVSPVDRTVGAASEHWIDSGTDDAYIKGKVSVGGLSPDPYAKFRVLGGRMRIYSIQSDNLHMGFRNGDADSTNPMAWMGVDTSGNYTLGDNNGQALVTFQQAGNVGIGTTSPGYKLAVNGSIGCTSLTVASSLASSSWPDFVFHDGYKLPSLDEVETFIDQNKHLPGVPSAHEVAKSGVNIGDMSATLLQKVEELTLYVIELKKENAELRSQLSAIKDETP